MSVSEAVELVAKLWPRAEPFNDAEAESWMGHLARFDQADVREAISNLHAIRTFRPSLAEVVREVVTQKVTVEAFDGAEAWFQARWLARDTHWRVYRGHTDGVDAKTVAEVGDRCRYLMGIPGGRNLMGVVEDLGPALIRGGDSTAYAQFRNAYLERMEAEFRERALEGGGGSGRE